MTEVKGELTAELALKLTFIMWEDMAEEEKQLGRKLNRHERWHFKREWLVDRGFVDGFGACSVNCACLLCEYNVDNGCGHCLVDWSANCTGTCIAAARGNVDYELTPAGEFLEYMKTHVRKEE